MDSFKEMEIKNIPLGLTFSSVGQGHMWNTFSEQCRSLVVRPSLRSRHETFERRERCSTSDIYERLCAVLQSTSRFPKSGRIASDEIITFNLKAQISK
jgi:hypothetical protein